MAAIDLYSGIGGWTLGFKMAGIEVASSYEWWKDANNTHNKNFGSTHNERDIRKLRLEDLPNPDSIEFVIGSPPCTQFSYANRGGNGDIADGLIDIHKFLEVVEYLNPRYWAMENVPRVANILKREIQEDGSLYRFTHLFANDGIRVYDSSDFGVPQKRKRMIAGNLPFDLLESYKNFTPILTMGDILEALNGDTITDPIYGTVLNREELTDHIKEIPLSAEEARINGDAKSYHTVYNKMSFPDRWEKPSRTITALCTRVSRESIIIEDEEGDLRRLTVRERGCLQSFPINYQYYSNSYGGKLKMIGNAVPPVLTFYIAQSMLETDVENLILPNQANNPIVIPDELPIIHTPDNRGAKYSWSRSFWLAIPGLRFGSGVRFELRNYHDKRDKSSSWRMNFFYGNSKNIKKKELGLSLFERGSTIINELNDNSLNTLIQEFIMFCKAIDIIGLQQNWTNKDRERNNPIDLIDRIGEFSSSFKNILEKENISQTTLLNFIEGELKNEEGKIDNKKLSDEPIKVFIGLILGSCFNAIMEGKRVQLEFPLAV
ncbi:DNA (cytosine-5-)-methyltransferase [Ascidiimonas sp. W6]|uniref:DNA cytosine methyltransferase n=1 Tax=Ascidiimonas meishanensis TaxID=3128903 RepID=UPI0030ECA996